MSNFYCRRMISEHFHGGDRQPFALPGTKAQYARDRVCDVRHIKLDVALDLKLKKVWGTCSTTVSPIHEGVISMEFDSVELSIESVKLANGKTLEYDLTDEKLKVWFGRALNMGEEVTVVVAYHAFPRRGFYFIQPDKGYPKKPWQAWSQGQDEDSRCWFPCFDFPNEKATTEMLATVPAKYFALSNGQLMGIRPDKKKGTKTYHWRQDIPHVSYLVTLAVGEFAEVKDQAGKIPLQYYVKPGQESLAKLTFSRTPEMIKHFGSKIGVNFPYEKYAQVCVADFIFGGMENTSATTLIEEMLFDKRASLDYDTDGLIAHELAHQWWGDLLTCKDWSHGWLNEGFATYFDALWTEQSKGKDEFQLQMWGNALAYFGEDGEYRRPIVTNMYQEPIDLFDRHLYEKGSWVLNMLRFELGEGLFWKSLKHYAETYRGQCVETKQFQGTLEAATGRSLDKFFTQWVYQAGYPQFKVSYEWEDEHRMAKLTVQQTQTVDETTPLFDVEVEVAFGTKKIPHRTRVHVSEKEQVFHIPLDEKPLWVSFDPDNWILKTLDFSLPLGLLKEQVKKAQGAIERMRAVQGLAKQGSPEAVEILGEAVKGDAFWGVQAEAAKALGQMKTDAALDQLAACRTVKHPKARRAVAAALGSFKRPEAVKLLAPMAKQDPSYFVEAAAVSALGRTRQLSALPHIRLAMKKNSYNEVIRGAAIEALGEFEDDAQAVKTLKEYTRYGQPWQLRARAVSVLGKIGEGKKEIRDLLIDLLEDPSFRIKMSVIGALIQVRDEKAIPALNRMAEREVDGRFKRRCRDAVRQIVSGKKLPPEIKRLQDEVEKMADEQRKLKTQLQKYEVLVKVKKSKK